MAFAVEDIPDEDSLFLRVHKNDIIDNKVIPGAYKVRGQGGMSTDWSYYSTPQQSLARARNPNDTAIVSLSVKAVRAIEELTVVHCPIEEDIVFSIKANQAHAEVYGIPKIDPFKTRIRLLLDRIAQWEIKYPR